MSCAWRESLREETPPPGPGSGGHRAPVRLGRVLSAIVLACSALSLAGCPGEHHRPGFSERDVLRAGQAQRLADRAPPFPESAEQEADEPASEHADARADEPGGEPSPQAACALPLADWRSAGWHVNHEVPPSARGFLRTRVATDAAGAGELAIRWELRDDEGLTRGLDRFLCVGEDLLLDRVETEGVTTRFVPPLPVTSRQVPQSGVTEGTVLLLGPDAHVSAPYRLTWSFSRPEGVPELAPPEAVRWVRTQAHLEVALSPAVAVTSDTVQGLGETLFLTATRHQRLTVGDETGERHEVARRVFRP